MTAPNDRESTKKREDLIAFLNSADAPVPTRLDAESPSDSSNAGFVTVNFEDATVTLKNRERTLRLVWSPDDKERKRFVPAGDYQIIGYTLSRSDTVLHSTGKGRSVDIKSGEETRIELETRVRATLKVTKVNVRLMIAGEPCMGLTILRDGQRVTPTFEIRKNGEFVSAGELKYG